MNVTYIEGPAGRAVPVLGSSQVDTQDPDYLRARLRELERLCTDVLVAAVDLGLPQPLLNRLWAAVGHGELPHAFHVELPPKTVPPPAGVVPETSAAPSGDAAPSSALAVTAPSAAGHPAIAAVAATDAPPAVVAPPPAAPMPIPDIPLTSNPLAARPEGAAKAPPQADLRPLTTRKTVLVVDDDSMMLDVLERILQRENFTLLLASGGPQMLEKLAEHDGDVDLLVTDYAMPQMQGRELAERIRQRYPGVKVLYQTGFSDRLFESCVELEEGAAFLEKPFTARGLREAARLVLFGTINPS